MFAACCVGFYGSSDDAVSKIGVAKTRRIEARMLRLSCGAGRHEGWALKGGAKP